jgi:GT2 family glycosyltransferase
MVEVAAMSEAPRPVVSVCIANYNGIGLIEACIDSVREQSDAPTFEIIVHDDASTDGSVAWLRVQPDVRLIVSDQNVGFCVSNNRMVEAARGRFALLLNNDATLLPDALQTLDRRSEEFAHSAILGMPQFDAADGRLIDRGCWLDWMMSPVSRRGAGKPPAMVIGACLWIPRRIWDCVGGFPEFFVTNAEDVYLCCAAKAMGYKVDVTAGSGFRHLVGARLGGGRASASGQLVLSRRRRYLSERNRLLVSRIFLSRWQRLLAWPAHWTILLAEALVMAFLARDMKLLAYPYLQSQRDALRMLDKADEIRTRIMGGEPRTRDQIGPMVLVPSKLRLLLSHGLPRA